mmetsp:Transcript_4418/g.15821  ORF Transcript_4418/g.15821 Transcript_4418/m.15821 type:complete len:97 (-) Transcript_4418:34-324(-)
MEASPFVNGPSALYGVGDLGDVAVPCPLQSIPGLPLAVQQRVVELGEGSSVEIDAVIVCVYARRTLSPADVQCSRQLANGCLAGSIVSASEPRCMT